MSDAYDYDRFLIKSNGSVTKDNEDNRDTKNHVYAENLKDARAKAVKKGLTVKGLKEDNDQFFKAKH
tara:strand:- start:338 stop:538 length:201 start_codon:yes stop_codon:yes gene_type:complete